MKSSTIELMMLDSGTTTHMIQDIESLEDTSICGVPISLGDDSQITATHWGSTRVTWKWQGGETEVEMTGTRAAPNLAMRLLSILALTEKGLCVLSVLAKAVIMEIEDDILVLGTAFKGSDGLSYIPTNDNLLRR